MGAWQPLVEIVILLLAALILGTLAEWFKQNAIVGYLVAGALVGPYGLGLVTSGKDTELIAEIGVALLLFTIGLEFSIGQLRAMGKTVLMLGAFQVTVTAALVTLGAMALGMPGKTSFAVGLMVAMSSTACVLRLLRERAELDTVHGRNALGVLLVQDIAVVPALVLISAIGYGGGPWQAAGKVGLAVLAGAAMVFVFYLLSTHVVPRALHLKHWSRNRELPILLAIVMALGAAVVAHELGLSPAMGAFLVGLLLGSSPFAVQIRSDISALRTVLVTFFFASIGMLGNLTWALENIWLVLGVVVLIITIKSGIIVAVMRILRQAVGHGRGDRSGPGASG